MDPEKEIEDLEVVQDEPDAEESASVDDFIRELEEKEKDLHITLETTVIEIEQGFDDANPSVFLPEQLATSHLRSGALETDGAHQSDAAEQLYEDRSEEISVLEEQVDDLEDQLSALKQTIARMEEERSEIFKNSQRRAKDFAAYKARTERERGESIQNQASELASRLLPAIDNLNRAIEFADHVADEKGQDFRQFFDGIVMVNQQVMDIFQSMGIEAISSVGQTFDPHLHEAVATEVTNEVPPNTICEELLRGYRIGDRVIRHSMVKVATQTNVSAENLNTIQPETDMTADEAEAEGTTDEGDPEMSEALSEENE